MTSPIPLHPHIDPATPATGTGHAAHSAERRIIRRATDEVIARLMQASENAASALNMNSHEREFLPAALEVIETPVSPTVRLTTFAICGLFTFALAWSCFSHIDMVAVASGRVIPLGQVKVVQPLETSAIHAIHVDDGDHVSAGQVLVDLDPTDVKADLGSLIYDRGQAALDAEVARLLLTRDPDGPFAVPSDVDPVLAEANRLQARAEISRHFAQIAAVDAEIAQKQASKDANEATIERARNTLPLIEEKNATARSLYDKKYGARAPVLDSEQLLIEKRAELASSQAVSRQISAEAAASQAKRDELVSGFLADASDRRTKALQKLSGLDQQISKARSRESYRHLVASVDGSVQNVKIHTPGAVVTTADTLMTIVPDGAGIEIEANVENKDIGFVREGQDVEVKFDAFPFTRYGLIKGKVRKLGRDAAPQPATGAASSPAAPSGATQVTPTDAAYAAKVSLDRDWIVVDGHREILQPGMRVSAEIRTGNRLVIEYLLSPVVQAVSEAGRER